MTISLQKLVIISFAILLSFNCYSSPKSSDRDKNIKWLYEYIDNSEIRHLRNEPLIFTEKYYLGQALFFDPILSTNKDISCATCHLIKRGSSDGISKSIGTGGRDLAEKRKKGSDHIQHNRNSQALWNLDNNAVKNLFWDGRIEVLDPINDIYRTPLNELLPKSIENALAAQALFPIVNQGEMFNETCNLKGEDLKTCIRLVKISKLVDRPSWISIYHSMIIDRLIGTISNKKLNSLQIKYRNIFKKAYKNIELNDIDFGHIGNAIAHFEEIAFATRNVPWDGFIRGNSNYLNDSQLIGARLFFGEAECVRCHSGPLFSDFDFHSLGIVSIKENKDEDIGRAEVTKLNTDRFKFRTPSLRNSTLTSPYMHDGSIKTLEKTISRHFDGCNKKLEGYNICLSTLSVVGKSYNQALTSKDIQYLISFLGALEDNSEDKWIDIIPKKVPSGLAIDKLSEIH
jgi:cytochrome c peroxidase